ncbi:MAG: hypothetical protein LUH02_10445 [Erysipelotrichaceae bacterium]|nr:hypothetical protein [Erysipelotrichaceae bacterium]
MMFGKLHVVVSSEKEEDCEMIKELLYKMNNDFSISPTRPYPLAKGCSDFYITCHMNKEDVQPLLDQLNNDWDGDIDDCVCYGFNTKMFHPLVYHLSFILYD